MVYIFDGRAFAATKEAKLKDKVSLLKRAGVTPKLVSIIVGDNRVSKLYLSLKRKAAKRVGAELEIKIFAKDTTVNQLINLIEKLNKEKSVNGIMIQLPLPERFSKSDREEIINAIGPKKDVDGLREDSLYLAPTPKAVIEAIKIAELRINNYRLRKVTVVGARGFVGEKIAKLLREKSYQVIECNSRTKDLKLKTKKADILISATGVPGLIKKEMIKKGAVVIDIGAPKGDVLFDDLVAKASFITPVPGGIGPVTIVCLLENLIEAC